MAALSAWPERDPECVPCGGLEGAADTPEQVNLDNLIGKPEPPPRAQSETRDNLKMLEVLSTRNFSPSPKTMAQQRKDREEAFALFQNYHDGVPYIYAFDLEMALKTACLEVDEYQAAALRQRFG
eukprot:Sspe_Gene.864::Locus_291_Transcript_4_10_Confidence_0.304_Length_508::g.864::m.864